MMDSARDAHTLRDVSSRMHDKMFMIKAVIVKLPLDPLGFPYGAPRPPLVTRDDGTGRDRLGPVTNRGVRKMEI